MAWLLRAATPLHPRPAWLPCLGSAPPPAGAAKPLVSLLRLYKHGGMTVGLLAVKATARLCQHPSNAAAFRAAGAPAALAALFGGSAMTAILRHAAVAVMALLCGHEVSQEEARWVAGAAWPELVLLGKPCVHCIMAAV